LLAQADSCIGSKSSINIGPYKNQLGTFDPPRRILIPSDVLNTLPSDEIRSGLGEIIKVHALAGEPEMLRIKAQLPTPGVPFHVLSALIRSTLEVKKRYIEEDEFDRGIRNILNYGHTFGHAYESASHYAIPHGIAVTLGMLTAMYISEQQGMLPKGIFETERTFLEPLYTPFESYLSQKRLSDIIVALRRDKKNTDGHVTCILTRGYGRMEKVSLDAERDLKPLLQQLLGVLSPAAAGLESR
jgi:3-dehydroquinate synthase